MSVSGKYEYLTKGFKSDADGVQWELVCMDLISITHPGTILQKEYLEPMGLTQKELADHLDIPIHRVNEIVRGNKETQ